MRTGAHGSVACTNTLARREYSRANNTLQELPRTPGKGRLFPTPDTKRVEPRMPPPPDTNNPFLPPPTPPPTTRLEYPLQPEQPTTQVMQPRAPSPPKPLVLHPLPGTPPQGQVAMPLAPQQPAAPKAQVVYAEPSIPAPPAPSKPSAPLPSKDDFVIEPAVTRAAGAVDMYGIPQGYGPRPSGQTPPVTVRVVVPAPPPARPLTVAQQILADAAASRTAAQATAQIDANRQVAIEREHTITSIATTAGNAIGETGATIRAVFQSANDTALARLQIQSTERLRRLEIEAGRAGGATPNPAVQAQMDALQTLVTQLAARREEIAAPTATTTQGITATPTAAETAAANAANTKKTMLYVGLGIVGVAAIGGVAYVALRKKDEPKHNPSLPSYPPGAYGAQYGIR